jgi:hypothetical protein
MNYSAKHAVLWSDETKHMSMVRIREEEKSSVAKHLLSNPGHVTILENLSVVKRMDRPQHLNAWKSIIIRKNDKKHLLWKHRVITNLYFFPFQVIFVIIFSSRL